MKKILLITTTFALLLTSYSTSFGQKSYITVEQTKELAFGAIELSGSSGSLTIGKDGAISSSNIILYDFDPRHRAEFKLQFHLRGLDLFENVKSITVQPNTTLYRVGGGGSIQLTNLTQYGPVNIYMGQVHNFPHPNYVYFNVGGTINISASNAPGDYKGTYDVTITHD